MWAVRDHAFAAGEMDLGAEIGKEQQIL